MKFFSATLSLVFLTLTFSVLAQAQGPINYGEQARLSSEAQQLWWASLSSREKQLVRNIDNLEAAYRKNTGNAYIPLTKEGFIFVVNKVGATKNEAKFVYDRMAFNAKLYTTLNQVDSFLEYTQKNPEWYLPPNMRSGR